VLALARIVVPMVIVASPELHAARALVTDPASLRFVPDGLGLVARLPLTPEVARVLFVVALSSAATAMLGWMSRISLATLTVSAGLLFSVSQRSGAVLHDMHLFWLTALLATSPCGDAWSIDAWGSGPPPARAPRYGVPLLYARAILGVVYLFPGIHKLRVSGLSWISAENVVHQMHAKWLEHGALPPVRVDQAPWLCALGALGVVAFELSFLFLALGPPRARIVALASGLAFHLSTQVFLFIPFVSLWACYVVLLDGAWLERLDDRLRGPRAPRPPRTGGDEAGRQTALTLAVGSALVVAAVVQGARGATQAWPFACYPTFAERQGPTIPDILVEATLGDGTHRALTGREHRARTQAEWGHVFRLAGGYGGGASRDALVAHARRVLAGDGIDPASVLSVRMSRVMVPTAPARWAEAPTGGVLLSALEGPLPRPDPPLRAP